MGVAVTPVAFFLSIVSGGSGHGDYGAARLLYPYSMLLTRLTDNHIGWLALSVAMLQFPVYGAAMGIGASRPRRLLGTCAIVAAGHASAAIACFSGLLPNFS